MGSKTVAVFNSGWGLVRVFSSGRGLKTDNSSDIGLLAFFFGTGIVAIFISGMELLSFLVLAGES